MQTLPFSDDESPHITPNLSKKLPPKSQLHSSSKAGYFVAAPVIISIYLFFPYKILYFVSFTFIFYFNFLFNVVVFS